MSETKFQVGDVCSFGGAIGAIINITKDKNYPIKFKPSEGGGYLYFSIDGKYHLCHAEPLLKFISRPSKKVKKTVELKRYTVAGFDNNIFQTTWGSTSPVLSPDSKIIKTETKTIEYETEEQMKFEIKHRFTGELIIEVEAENWRFAVELAIKKGANLRNADLREADLSSADLSSANLRYADLSSANLRYADLSSTNLRSANLRYADLRNANLRSADLSSADLSYADLSSANLSSADLSSANLRSVNLRNANLRSADLSFAREDFTSKLLALTNEIPFLYKALIDGKVDGSTYSGECACFVGTIAKARNTQPKKMPDLVADSDSPIERLFLAIGEGDTPENNQVSSIVVDWIREFCTEKDIKLPTHQIVWSES